MLPDDILLSYGSDSLQIFEFGTILTFVAVCCIVSALNLLISSVFVPPVKYEGTSA